METPRLPASGTLRPRAALSPASLLHDGAGHARQGRIRALSLVVHDHAHRRCRPALVVALEQSLPHQLTAQTAPPPLDLLPRLGRAIEQVVCASPRDVE